MFPASYFGPRYFPAPYWPKVGAAITSVPGPSRRVSLNLPYRQLVFAPDRSTVINLPRRYLNEALVS